MMRVTLTVGMTLLNSHFESNVGNLPKCGNRSTSMLIVCYYKLIYRENGCSIGCTKRETMQSRLKVHILPLPPRAKVHLESDKGVCYRVLY